MTDTILIVDDEDINRDILKQILEPYYCLLEAKNGNEAIELLETNGLSISAILLDIIMPGINGYEVLQRIHVDALWSKIPVIVCTVMSDTESQNKALALGAYGFTSKPYNVPFLRSSLQNAISMRRADAKLLDLMDNIPCGVAMYEYEDEKLTALQHNLQYWKMVERKPSESAKNLLTDYIHPDSRETIANEIKAALHQGREISCDIRILHSSGKYKPFHVAARYQRESDSKYIFYATYTPISDEDLSYQQMLILALSTVMSCSPDYSYIKDRDSRYISCNKATAKLFGYESERELIGKTDGELFNFEQTEKFEEQNRLLYETGTPTVSDFETTLFPDGSIHHLYTSKYPLLDSSGKIFGLYGISKDVTAEYEKEQQLQFLSESVKSANLDALTGLLTRKTFTEKAAALLSDVSDTALYALLIVDLDGFKEVNDTFGHNEGDAALIEVAQKLTHVFLDEDLICRLGGDEFIICLDHIAKKSIIENIAKKLCYTIHKDFGHHVILSASIGIVIVSAPGNDYNDLYRKADAAMYYVKRNGKNNYAFYDESMELKS